ncbi:hypothetical protein C8J56DRAFT_1072517 [Mycena floridula]|nr:hypothetical protein C8J56DRAFT_1072517 [Mycena floridula]
MDSGSDDEPDVVFDATVWIGTNKIYHNVPLYVSHACEAAAAMSQALKESIPPPNTTIPFFLAFCIPSDMDGHVPQSSFAWFSTDLPRLGKLQKNFGQEFLNGSRSIKYPGDDDVCYELGAVQFWREMHTVREAQEKWESSRKWLADQDGILDDVYWNTVHRDAPDGQLPNLFSLSGGDTGWERWQRLTHHSIIRVFDLKGGDQQNDDDEEDDYDEPDVDAPGSSKKRRAKPPRGATKRQKKGSKKPTKKAKAKK